MKISTTGAWIITLLCFASGILWPLGLIGICISLYITIKSLVSRRSSGETEELARQREAERREAEMGRKSNEILLHLIQDEHREEEDR